MKNWPGQLTRKPEIPYNALRRLIGPEERGRRMANILDYVAWRGDIPFDQVPLGEVDGLILSYLAYVPFDDIVP